MEHNLPMGRFQRVSGGSRQAYLPASTLSAAAPWVQSPCVRSPCVPVALLREVCAPRGEFRVCLISHFGSGRAATMLTIARRTARGPGGSEPCHTGGCSMSIRVMAAAVATAAGLALAFGGLALSADAATSPRVQLTGTQLLAALLPASDFPAGYKLEKSGIYDSGSHLLTAPAKYNLATQSCRSFSKTFGQRGFGETAVAADAFSNGGSALKAKLFEIDQSGTISGFKLGFKLVFTVAGQDLFSTGNVGVLTAPPTSPSPRTTMLRLINRV